MKTEKSKNIKKTLPNKELGLHYGALQVHLQVSAAKLNAFIILKY